jgi:hypothetical protein
MATPPRGRSREDRIRQLFYEAIESFPVDARDAAELWLYECEVARIFLDAVEGLSSLRHRPRRAD